MLYFHIAENRYLVFSIGIIPVQIKISLLYKLIKLNVLTLLNVLVSRTRSPTLEDTSKFRYDAKSHHV